MSDPFINQEPRRRRSDKHLEDKAPRREEARRPAYPREEAPLPLGGFDAAAPARDSQPERPQQRVPENRVYQESDYHPPRRDPYPQAYDDEYYSDLPPRRWPWLLLAALLVAVIVMSCAYFFVPKDATGILGSVRSASATVIDGGLKLVGLKKEEPPKLLKFDTPLATVQTGVRTVFTITADKLVEDVRILDEVGMEIQGVRQPVDSPYNTTWTLAAIISQPQTLNLSAGMKSGGIWYQTDRTVSLTVADPTPTPEPPTPTPTAAPTPAPPPVTDPPPQEPDPVNQEPAGEGAGAQAVIPPVVVEPQTQPTPVTVQGLLPVFTPAPGQEETAQEQQPVDVQVTDTQTADTQTADTQTATLGVNWADLPLDDDAQAAEPALDTAPATDTQAAQAEAQAAEPAVDTAPAATAQADAQVADTAPADTAQADTQAMEAPPEPSPAPVQVAQVPQATPMPALVVSAADGQAPGKFKWTEAVYQGSRKQNDYSNANPIDMQGGELYTYYPGGVFTFRGDNLRQNAAFGTAPMPLDQLSVLWQAPLGSLRTSDSGTLYGAGWTGQPAIVKWSVEVREMMNLNAQKKAVRALKEVIFAGQDGKVYFFDLNDGQPTREPIEVGFPLKGSVTVDPTGRPLISFGQGISKLPGKTGDIGYHIYNLIDQSRLSFINGRQSKSQVQYSTNGAFDGTALMDRGSDSLVIAGENGLLYTVALNSVFDFKDQQTITIDPDITYLRSKGSQADASTSMEASVAMYGATAFVADKQGYVRAVDTTTMQTLWVFDAGDNTDATPALDLENGSNLALYTATTVHARSRRDGHAVIRRLDALTGEEVWQVPIKAKYDATERGGVKASPVVGQGQISNLVIFTVNLTEEGGAILALDKNTGNAVWKVPLKDGGISSPVAVYDDAGRARIIQADGKGLLHLIDGQSGRVIHTLDLGGPVDGSPAVYGDVLVIGGAGKDNNFMYGIRLE